MKAEIIVITNQKGGVGKSTTAEAMAEGLLLQKNKVLLIDLDPQGSISLTAGFADTADDSKPNAYDLMMNKEISAQEVIQNHAHRVDIIPAGKNLAKLDIELTSIGKDHRLKEKIAPVLTEYDYIIIDTPPALGILTINALTAADSVLIPAQADLYSLQGISQLYDTIGAVRTYTNQSLRIEGILLTRHNSRNILSRDMTDTARNTAAEMGTFLYDTVIRECIALKEAQASQQNIYEYAPKSNAATDYLSFVNEFIKRRNGHE
jgi:ATPases involved in chromosome partitioning